MRNHALVLGGSMAGLLAARALADHFEIVTLVEREQESAREGPRKGVPQGHHIHALMVRGKEILEDFFPGFADDLVGQGATQIDFFQRAKIDFGSGVCSAEDSLVALFMSRPLIERYVASRVRSLDNVRFENGCSAEALTVDSEGKRVTGVVLRSRDAIERALEADFVVDASGRGSRLPTWLTERGFPPPPESRVDIATTYASRIFRRPPGEREWDMLLMLPAAPSRRGGSIFPIEGDRWLVSLVGMGDDAPSGDDAGFLDYARSLASDEVYRNIVGLEPETSVKRYRFAGDLRRRYEGIDPFPDRLAVVGDSTCSFNPRFGQGMSIAAMEAHELHRTLAASRSFDGLARRFQHRVAKQIDMAWPAVVAEDLRYEDARGDRTLGLKVMQWYMGRVMAQSARSPKVWSSFLRVTNFVAPPSTLFRPRTFVAALLGR